MEQTRKKQLKGGTLRKVMAAEIKRVLAKYGQTEEGSQRILDMSAIELGITPRTLRDWCGPVDKKGWEELQVPVGEAMDKLLSVAKKPMKKKKKGKKCAGNTKRGRVFA